jgi:hypothetical protein
VAFLVVDSSTFAYEPILKCLQERTDFPLTEELFLYEKDAPVNESSLAPWAVVKELKEKYRRNIQHILQTARPITLDPSQLDSLSKGLTQRLSLIQGPPGMNLVSTHVIAFETDSSIPRYRKIFHRGSTRQGSP